TGAGNTTATDDGRQFALRTARCMAPIGVESRRGQDESTIDDISRTHTSSVKQRLLLMFPFNRCFWLPGWTWEVSTRFGR
ncbi:MAG: hypothetical protein QOF74_4160, partial [Caballeronia mineralivorans]|nr:hypothetical protein [Caballeronia mineralivorans]